MDQLKEELLSGKRVPEHKKVYGKCFIIKETPKRNIAFSCNKEAVDNARERCGFFALVSNEVKDSAIAISLYRMRDVVEKDFWNLKQRLNLRRAQTSSELSLEGKLFVEFVALIYLSSLQQKMESVGMFSRYTMHELDAIECFMEPRKAPIYGQVLMKQEELYLTTKIFLLKGAKCS